MMKKDLLSVRNNMFILIGKLFALGCFNFRKEIVHRTIVFLIGNPMIMKICYSNFISLEANNVQLADFSYDQIGCGLIRKIIE